MSASPHQGDIIPLDISVPGGNGLETARVLKQRYPQTKILMVSQQGPKLAAIEFDRSQVDEARLAIDLFMTIRGLRKHIP